MRDCPKLSNFKALLDLRRRERRKLTHHCLRRVIIIRTCRFAGLMAKSRGVQFISDN